jgi:hypothetical protein
MEKKMVGKRISEKAISNMYFKHFNRVPVPMMEVGGIYKLCQEALANGDESKLVALAASYGGPQ